MKDIYTTKTIVNEVQLFDVGPGLGALLYEAGGFELPFIIVGSIGIVVAIALIFVIPDVQLDKKQSDGAKKLTYVEIAKVSGQK